MSLQAKFVTIALSVGLSIGAVLLLQSRDREDRVPVTSDDAPRLVRLERMVEQLQRRLDQQPATPLVGISEVRVPERTRDDGRTAADLTALAARVQTLEAAVAKRQPSSSRTVVSPEEAQRQLARQQETIIDPVAKIADKIAAHHALRSEPKGYTEAMLQELTRIGLSHTDEEIRADVWRQFDGAQKPRTIVPALLQALARDASASVRDEAAETLANFLDDASVRQALAFTSENDADPTVRRRAGRSLEGWQRRRGSGK